MNSPSSVVIYKFLVEVHRLLQDVRLEIIIQRRNIRRVLFPGPIVHESPLVHVFLQQPIELVVIDS
jgi:hypothetical protein